MENCNTETVTTFDHNVLCELLEKSGLSREELAEATDIKEPSLYQYLTGKAVPPLPRLIKLADYFAVPLDVLCGRCSEETARNVLEDYGNHFQSLRRASYEAYCFGYDVEKVSFNDSLYCDKYPVAPWPYNLIEVATGVRAQLPISEELKEGIETALDFLRPREAKALIMVYHDEMSLTEVAKAYGKSHDWASQLHQKAIRKLRSSEALKILISRGTTYAEIVTRIWRKQLTLEEVRAKLMSREALIARYEKEIEATTERLSELEAKQEEAKLKVLAVADTIRKAHEANLGPWVFTTNWDSPPQITIEDLGLSVRAYNCLKRNGVKTVGELLKKSKKDLLQFHNLGKVSLEEIRQHVLALVGPNGWPNYEPKD